MELFSEERWPLRRVQANRHERVWDRVCGWDPVLGGDDGWSRTCRDDQEDADWATLAWVESLRPELADGAR